MTFPLTKTGRENLEAILAEFERAGRYYPPLYHERLVAWSEKGEVRLSDAQWQAFIEAESNKLDESEWSEWSGPHFSSHVFTVPCLDRWYGDPDGLQEFINLAESVTEVLQREDFSSIDEATLSFAFRSWSGWLSTLHAWAFKFRMPLLSSSMNLWGAEDTSEDEFYERSEQMSRTGDLSWPLHPVCWSLTYNVFTSSAAAIRAILRPDTVIALNEPWPCSKIGTRDLTLDIVDVIPPTPCHRIVQDAVGWHVHFAGSPHPLLCSHKAGWHQIAVLIRWQGSEFQPSELAQFGSDKTRSYRTPLNLADLDYGDGLTVSKFPFVRHDKDDPDYRRKAEEHLRILSHKREEALRKPDASTPKLIEDINEEVYSIAAQLNVNTDNGDFEVKPQRPFRDESQQKAYDLVSRNIRNAIAGLKKRAPQYLKEIEELEYQILLPRLVFEPKDHFTRWVVEPRNGRQKR